MYIYYIHTFILAVQEYIFVYIPIYHNIITVKNGLQLTFDAFSSLHKFYFLRHYTKN